MKARLYGLLALMLCAMMVVMPAVAMGADGDALDYPILYQMNQNVAVKEEDIILDSTEVRHSSGHPLRLVFDLENVTDIMGSGTTETLSFRNPMNNGLIGWRVKSLAHSTVDNQTYDTIYLEPVYYRLADGTATVNGETLTVTAYDHIFEPKTSLGSYSSREAIEEAFKQYAEQNNYGSALSFREIGAYKPVVFDHYNNHVVLQKLDTSSELTISFTEAYHNKNALAGKIVNAHLLHMKDNGTIEDKPISIVNGKYTVTLSDFSPFAIAYNPNDVSSGNGTTLPGGSGVIAPSGSTAAPNLPQTGDNSQLLLWSALALLSLTGAVLSIRRKKA